MPTRTPSRPGARKPASKKPAAPKSAKAANPFPGRIARLRAQFNNERISHLLVTNPLDVAYLTGFHGGDSYLFLSPDSATIISDFRYQEELAPISKLAEIFIRKGSIVDAVAQVCNRARAKQIGLQADHITIGECESLVKALGFTGPSRVVMTHGLVAAMRTIKDDSEIALITKALDIQQEALEAVLPHIKPGMTEMEIAARIEFEMKSRGSSQPGFQTIVAAEPYGSLPHYRPGPAKVARNRSVLIDWGSIYHGYHGDMTRTFALGKWPAKIKEIYNIVLDAHNLAAQAIMPGKTTKEIDAVARDYITKHGYGEQFGHGLGHGIGFNGHEEPRLSHMLAATELKVGQVVTVEPGIYLPGVGGVRIEDCFLITPKGAKNLCTMPKTLEWSTL